MYIKRHMQEWSIGKTILAPQMIFIAGPRQAGKTTLIEQFLTSIKCGSLIFNWDTPDVKKKYRSDPLFFESEARLLKGKSKQVWIGLDEIHKRVQWKNILKGYYDQFKNDFRFIVSGSARLDIFRKTGDALIGRYFLFNLFPFSLSEIGSRPLKELSLWQALIGGKNFSSIFDLIAGTQPLPYDLWEQLYEFGPFPDPLIKSDYSFSNLWHRDYISLYLREELRDMTRIADIDGVETLVSLLPDRVGSIMSINSLKHDLQVSHGTVATWLESLSRLYLIFSIAPWQKKIHKSIKKEKKYYFMDWAYVPKKATGQRFENMVAVYLLRLIHALNENGLGDYKLHFVRDLSKREVDFIITDGSKPLVLIEAKTQAMRIPGFALNLAKKIGNIPVLVLTHQSGNLKKIGPQAYIISAHHFFSCIP